MVVSSYRSFLLRIDTIKTYVNALPSDESKSYLDVLEKIYDNIVLQDFKFLNKLDGDNVCDNSTVEEKLDVMDESWLLNPPTSTSRYKSVFMLVNCLYVYTYLYQTSSIRKQDTLFEKAYTDIFGASSSYGEELFVLLNKFSKITKESTDDIFDDPENILNSMIIKFLKTSLRNVMKKAIEKMEDSWKKTSQA